MKTKDLYIFDLDGTLVDAYKAIERSLNFTRRKLGHSSVSFNKVKMSVGKGDQMFIGAFFDKKDQKEALLVFRKHHKKSLLKFSKLRPNVKRLLYTLKRRKKIIAIASNRPKYFTGLLLDKLKIKSYFNGIYCAKGPKTLKPNPKMLNMALERFMVDKEQAVYIGDMVIDLETAKRAKIDAVFTSGGSSTLSEAKKYKNKKVVYSLERILTLYN